MEIRNIAIIAHVDHGKTTLTDAILRQTGAAESGVSMDSNALEKERGITIYSKNASIFYKGTKINIVDTPGHADFGSEVERVLRSIDSVLLLVDAQEGPMPQTRFVLKKSLSLGLKPILVINKIDKPAADPDRTHNQVFELFAELGATNEQLDFPCIYTIGKEGIAKRTLADESRDMTPLLDLILEKVPNASKNADAPFRAQPFNLAYDNFLGRMAIVRVYEGAVEDGDTVYVRDHAGGTTKGKITKLFTFNGVTREEAARVEAGDIAMIAGLPTIYIGDTISALPDTPPLEAIAIDEPTIKLAFLVNDSPFAGREGKFVTSRQLRDRLEKELEVNVGLRIDFNTEGAERFTPAPLQKVEPIKPLTHDDIFLTEHKTDAAAFVKVRGFTVYGRGELHVAILLENMRREGYELQVSQPQVIMKEIDGARHEPFEELVADIPSEYQGMVIEKIAARGGALTKMETHDARVILFFEAPSRGIFGYRSKFIMDTKGEGILTSRVIGFKPYAGEIAHRDVGSMISQVTGKALAYTLDNLQTRGTLYIKENTEVYEGMVIGNTAKGEQMVVNPTKGKHLTNVRASGSDDAIRLTPPHLLTIETGLEIMADDEYLEITPKSVRLRKQYLTETERARAYRKK